VSKPTTVGKYLIERLQQAGLKHVFGIPGDYILGFYDLMTKSELKVVGTCAEAGAAFAADAYARIAGLGAVCVTYCVGGLNTINAVAGAFAEKSPLVVISGAPGNAERIRSPLLHHRVRDFNTQRAIFEQVTVAAVALEDPTLAPREIDRALAACLATKRPVYIELPRDMVHKACPAPTPWRTEPHRSDPNVLQEVLREAAAMLREAKRPVILAGVELHRFGLQSAFLRLAKRTGYPIAGTLLGKSVISEMHPQYLGVYEGAMGREDVRKAVEASDCLLILGAFMTDIDLGIHTAELDIARSINATAERISVRYHHYDDVWVGDFIEGLATARIGPRRKLELPRKTAPGTFQPRPTERITVRRFFERMNGFLTDDSVVIADIGDSLFGAADLTIHKRTEFLSPAYYTSMGFATPAAVGVQMARPHLRPIVFVGDGAFQMTGQELSTIARHRLTPIVFVLNNQGYTTERFIMEGPFNDIHEWSYHLFPQILRTGWGCEVTTEGELEEALVHARNNTQMFSLISVRLEPHDTSKALVRLCERLAERAGAKKCNGRIKSGKSE
jgi:indolepyruvate decarboxylase